MSAILDLNGWASCPDNVQWSELNEIAVALGDHVQLLLPKLSFKRKDSQGKYRPLEWQQIRIAASTFTTAELLLLDPLHLPYFSIGEEQSFSHVVSLAWSPIGLARHKRCSLAVLTSNHILSIWSPKSDHMNQHGWERALIVNHALVEEGSQVDFTYGTDNNGVDQTLRLPWRIRSFTWGPVFSCSQRLHTDDRGDIDMSIDCYFVAVTNDAGELVLLELRSPHQSVIDRNRRWSCHVVLRTIVSPRQHSLPKVSKITADVFRQGTFATDLAWCYWKSSPDAKQKTELTILAYRIGRQLYVRSLPIMISENGMSLAISPSTCTVSGEHEGPIKLITKVILADVGFACDELINDDTRQEVI